MYTMYLVIAYSRAARRGWELEEKKFPRALNWHRQDSNPSNQSAMVVCLPTPPKHHYALCQWHGPAEYPKYGSGGGEVQPRTVRVVDRLGVERLEARS